MATRKKAASRAVAKRGATNIDADWKKRAAERAALVAAADTPTGWQWFSIQAGRLTFGDEVMPTPLPVIVVERAAEHALYEGEYDVDNPQPPICAATELWREGYDERIKPHSDSPQPQADRCKDCWANAWGSGGGRRKACRQKMRLALMPADEKLLQDYEKFMAAEPAGLKVPPTSLGIAKGYFNRNLKATDLQEFEYVTALDVLPSKKNQFEISLTFEGELEDELKAIAFKKSEEVAEQILLPPSFEAPEVEEKPARRAPPKKKKAVGRKAPPKKAAPKRAPPKKAAPKKAPPRAKSRAAKY
jgi:hypothetical protein